MIEMTKEEAQIQLMNLSMKDYWTKEDKKVIAQLRKIVLPELYGNAE